jgi:hypothetical protein
MSVTINGSTGVSGVDGSASTPAYQGGDSNTGVFFPAADTIAFAEGGAEVARFDSSGRLLVGVTSATADGGVLELSGGITFPATAVAASNANTLDDYEEGTWTPVIEGSSTAGTGTYSTQVGRYTKVGNTVVAHLFLDWSAHTGSGNLRIAGLPFTPANVSALAPSCAFFADRFAYTGGLIGAINNGTGKIDVYVVNNGSASNLTLDTNAQVITSVVYQV